MRTLEYKMKLEVVLSDCRTEGRTVLSTVRPCFAEKYDLSKLLL